MSDPLPTTTLVKDKRLLGRKIGQDIVTVSIIHSHRGYATLVRSGGLAFQHPNGDDLEGAHTAYLDEIKRYEKHGYSKC